MDAYEEIMENRHGIWGEDADGWDTDEDWKKREKFKPEFCVGSKEQMSLSRQSIRILADIRKK